MRKGSAYFRNIKYVSLHAGVCMRVGEEKATRGLFQGWLGWTACRYRSCQSAMHM